MHLQVNPQSSVPLYAQIVEQVRNLILSGKLHAGGALPSVREISELIEVNSLTIQKALKILEGEKFIVIKRGVGAFVSDSISLLTSEQKENLIKNDLSMLVNYANELGILKNRFLILASDTWESERQ